GSGGSRHANVPVVVRRRKEYPLTEGEKPARVERLDEVGPLRFIAFVPGGEDGETQLAESDPHVPGVSGDDQDLCLTLPLGKGQAFTLEPVVPEGQVCRAEERHLSHVR